MTSAPAPPPTTAEKAAALAALHVPGDPLIVVNVWDAMTARIVARTPGVRALATASHSVAYALGVEDGEGMSVDMALAAAGRITATTASSPTPPPTRSRPSSARSPSCAAPVRAPARSLSRMITRGTGAVGTSIPSRRWRATACCRSSTAWAMGRA